MLSLYKTQSSQSCMDMALRTLFYTSRQDKDCKHTPRFQPWVHEERKSVVFPRLKPWAMFEMKFTKLWEKTLRIS